jgi:hypothetical protein
MAVYPTRVWGIKWATRTGGLLLYSPYSFKLIALNHTAAAIWMLSSGQLAAEQIVDKILGALNARRNPEQDEDSVRNDLSEGICELARQGLIVLLPEPAFEQPESLKLFPSGFGLIAQQPTTGQQREIPIAG